MTTFIFLLLNKFLNGDISLTSSYNQDILLCKFLQFSKHLLGTELSASPSVSSVSFPVCSAVHILFSCHSYVSVEERFTLKCNILCCTLSSGAVVYYLFSGSQGQQEVFCETRADPKKNKCTAVFVGIQHSSSHIFYLSHPLTSLSHINTT